MTVQPANFAAFIDAARDSVAREIATLRRDAQRERDTFAAEMRAARAEWETRLAAVSEVERRLAARLVTLKDGEPGRDGRDGLDGASGRDGIDGPPGKDGVDGKDGPAGADGRDGADGASVTAEELAPLITAEVERMLAGWERPKDGRSVSVEDVTPLILEAVAQAAAALPVPKDGRDGVDGKDGIDGAPGQRGDKGEPGEKGEDGSSVTITDIEPMLREMVAAIPVPKDGEPGERGPEGPMGKLPTVKAWEDRVYYEGEVCTFDGGAYQAHRDTGKAPPHEDWTCIVRAGRDGKDGSDGQDGRSPRVRELWLEINEYRELDIVALNGAAFIAKRDNPGPCPGEGWQLIASQGKRGFPGERVKGDRGPAGEPVIAMAIDEQGMLTLTNGDGSTVRCDLYPLLAKLKA